ncbi:Two-component sensor histidine kinase, contains HisKA and HATPase domains [Trichococcus flocculiformis]|nr:histidine kinase [Trichococcus sp. ES5]SHG08698.1 Two-component sensor histidine kinase, contains HisKA and HATPase domains [Trichococcus flocculiformis]
MNKPHVVDEDIQNICERYTKLNDQEIAFLKEQVADALSDKRYEDYDVFVDVRDAFTGEAIVVCHRRPLYSPSLYKERVVGKIAYRKDEPGPLRTLETSQTSIELNARSQEGVLIKQTSYPMKYKNKTIAVFIVEQNISNEIKHQFDVRNRDQSYEEVSLALEEMEKVEQSIANFLDDIILIFDAKGILRHHNKAAGQYYQTFGYMDSINSLHYDNLALDLMTFDRILSLVSLGEFESLKGREIKFDQYYFKSKIIHLPSNGFVIQIMKDITDQKVKESRKEEEFVTIQEIHHRVKNNLQTVVSLLRLQARRAESPEAKKVLNESVNRVLSIAATHELLSKQKEDNVQLKMVLDAVIFNLTRFFSDQREIDFQSEIDSEIILDSNKAVTIALIMNELIQNSYDHAFTDKETGMGKIHVEIKQENDLIFIYVADNGSGFDFEAHGQHNLGLQIVTSFVESKLNGTIAVDSNPHGTKTRITFKN